MERICGQGCGVVRERIGCMERGEWGMDLVTLAAAERRAVLDELKSIMAVYGPVCRTDSGEPEVRQPVYISQTLLWFEESRAAPQELSAMVVRFDKASNRE